MRRDRARRGRVARPISPGIAIAPKMITGIRLGRLVRSGQVACTGGCAKNGTDVPAEVLLRENLILPAVEDRPRRGIQDGAAVPPLQPVRYEKAATWRTGQVAEETAWRGTAALSRYRL